MEEHEQNRLDEVLRFRQLDLTENSDLQDIVDLASKLCDKPVAVISLLDDESNWLKVKSGVNMQSMPRETSFCQYTVEQTDLLIVPDAREDIRFIDNPLVQSDPKIRFYAGVPLISGNELTIGSLCLFDLKPGDLSELQQEILILLARQAMSLMELELSRKDLRKQIEEKDAKNDALMKIAQLQSHQIRQPLTSIMGLVNLVRDGYQAVDEDWLALFVEATGNFDDVIHKIVAETMAEKDLKAIRFNKMVEEIDDYAILLINPQGYVENWNKGARKIKGYRAEEIIGKHFSIFYTEEDRANKRPERLIAIAEKEGVARDEGWRVRKDGSLFWGSIVITAIHDPNSSILGFTKVTRDLSDIMMTRESLIVSEQLYKNLLEQTSRVARVGGWEIDLIKRSLVWTDVTREIHGFGPDYEPDLDTATTFYKKGFSRNKIQEALKLAIEEGKGWDLELQLITQSGKEIWVRAIGNSNFKDGICTKVYGTFQDIDKIKRKQLKVDGAESYSRATFSRRRK